MNLSARLAALEVMVEMLAANRKAKWMRSEKLAVRARDLAHDCYERIGYGEAAR